ncbi:MAG: PfkB family carbohydrate kinase [Bacteroidaceae bacterium]|nr:PfkB family carbohydrate kinase [Bacteroidaceae bacterium]MDO4956680.1 PfkB family carbohydrate kinase [Bacteroidales bacterium]
MKKICCIGHITLDKIITPAATTYLNGGTAYYFAHGMSNLKDPNFQLVTSLAESELSAVEEMRQKNIDVIVFPSEHTVYFENKYGENQDNRTQRVLAKADPFKVDQFIPIKADYYHLGSLLADDFPFELVRYLSTKGIVSLDVQGYLRKVVGKDVVATDWTWKREILKYVDILKVNEHEMYVLTGENDVRKAAEKLAEWGVHEVVITEGSLGSFIYSNDKLIEIRAYPPTEVVDATGCGDTYMTGYLYMRAQGASIRESGCFAAAMSTLKLEGFGPFNGTMEDIRKVIDYRQLEMDVK